MICPFKAYVNKNKTKLQNCSYFCHLILHIHFYFALHFILLAIFCLIIPIIIFIFKIQSMFLIFYQSKSFVILYGFFKLITNMCCLKVLSLFSSFFGLRLIVSFTIHYLKSYPQSRVRMINKNPFTRLIAQTHDGEVRGHEYGDLAPKACVSRQDPLQLVEVSQQLADSPFDQNRNKLVQIIRHNIFVTVPLVFSRGVNFNCLPNRHYLYVTCTI